ncbi:U-box domain-containing protein 35-like isoform X2 [Rosa rugosa]|uniref:U-box domain-containing protein 35-like isoform X2 n=1 Tax=Rosa rugosa TaxID=74645 RepID=UPI002B402CFA|nr:U-box domain-containing protein 35-like isoform X2 [Rosa rugosa]
MDRSEILEAEDNLTLQIPSPLSIVAIAINGNRKSKYIVKWALEKFIPEGNLFFKLIHVRARITGIPTPMGNLIPISEVREDVVAAYRKDMEWQTSELLLPYKKMCTLKKVQVDVVVIESDNVANAIAEEVSESAISNLVIGAPSRGLFTRKQKGLSPKISACTPGFCTVYAVSKGKLSSLRPSDSQSVGSIRDDNSDTSSISSSSSNASSSQTDRGSVGSYSHFRSPSLPMQRFQALSSMNQNLLNTKAKSNEIIHSKHQSLDLGEEKDAMTMNSYPSNSDVGRALSHSSSTRSFVTDNQSWTSDQASTSDVVKNYSSESQVNINLELEKLRIELRHVKGMYAMAQSETIDASRKISNLSNRRLEEAVRLKEISAMEEKAKMLAEQEKEKYEAAKIEADYMRQCIESEASQRREAEMKAFHDAKEKEKLENVLVGPVQQYQKFRWEDIVSATSSFSEDLRIGMGAYGTVYKSNFHHTTAAVKVLHSKENHQTKQFLQELEILSKIRHPHLLLLLGACPDHSCLVYEYMENGSLDDRLNQKNNTPPIPWFERFRIAWEVASALVFLHSSKPKPIIHRDLKPANILLDHNLVSKIGDVGLSTMLNLDPSMSSIYNETGPVGTMCYIDPEYQRTGVISPKSDVYALGMVILQLLTAKPAIAITHLVETAIHDKSLKDVLDPKAGSWPVEEARQLAELGLSCAELRRRDRPDLKEQVVPALERLKEVAEKARDSASTVQCLPPNHFICPILKDVMNEPCVAADGYTYDRRAIEKWLEESDNSPMTNLAMPNKHLIPNYTLLSAIVEWKSRKQ